MYEMQNAAPCSSFSMFLSVGSVLVIAKTLTCILIRVPFARAYKRALAPASQTLPSGVKKKKGFSPEATKEPEPKILSKAVLSNIFYKVLWLYLRSYSKRGAKSEAILGGLGALPNCP